MTKPSTHNAWNAYCNDELLRVVPKLATLGYALDDAQPHLQGERYLMQAVTTAHGRKLILLGKKIIDNTRVVIKVTSDSAGKNEIQHERTCRTTLDKIKFAYDVFFSPRELYCDEVNDQLIYIQEYVEQERAFLERPTEAQFTFALNAFKAQEGAHATTSNHFVNIQNTFGVYTTADYTKKFSEFITSILKQNNNAHLNDVLQHAAIKLNSATERIDQYCDFLTHVDFVPHNIRIQGGKIFLLDHSSLRIGNKYEGWARFLNFMTLYNRDLEAALIQYVRDNRPPEEYESLQLMRIYRLGEIIAYYTNTLTQSAGSLHALNSARVTFWSDVLGAVLEDKAVNNDTLLEYQTVRDSLRSPEEKLRQKGLH